MPTYEYRCGECTHQFEVFAKMSDPDPTDCPECGKSALSKILFPVAVHYKGSGFYSTDYGNKQSTDRTDQSAEKKAETGSSTESKAKIEAVKSGNDKPSAASKPSS